MTDISKFDPNAAGNPQLNIFGLPFTEEESKLIIQPVPWEATVNINSGTARSMEHIFRASLLIDIYHTEDPNIWRQGIFMNKVNKKVLMKSDYLKKESELLVDYTCCGDKVDDNDFMCKNLKEINEGGIFLNEWVYDHTIDYVKNNKLVGLLGGDHSIAQGYVKALSEKYEDFGILQIDAHCDLRKSYQGFIYSHATVMHNILEATPNVSKLVQVGVRNYCQEEIAYVKENPNRIQLFSDELIKDRFYSGVSWKELVTEIVESLPQQVYISFDIDGLEPNLCPSTAMPVPGGLRYEQVVYLVKLLVRSGRKIIGFDLSEVSPGDGTIDATTGAYLLWELCNWTLIAAKE